MASVLTGLSGQAALVVSGVVVARMLGVENRGHLALLTVLPVLIAQFGSLGLPLAATFEIAREPAIARPLMRRLTRFAIIQTSLLTVLHAAILVLVTSDENHEVQVAAASTIGMVPSLMLQQHGLAVLQGQHRYREFNVLRVAPVLLYAGLVLAIFLAGSGTLPAVAAGIVACLFLGGAVTLTLAIRGSQAAGPDASPPSLPHLLRFGVRSVLSSSSPSDGSGIDQAAVGLFLSTRALGLYVVAAAFMNLSRLVTQSIGLIAYPNVAERRDPDDAERAMWRFTAVGVFASLAIVLLLEFTVGHLIVLFFGQSFAPAETVARILLIAALFVGARRVLSDAARGADRPVVGTIAEIASWLVLIPGLVVLTPLLGLDGVAIALAIASATSLCVIVWGVRRPRRAAPLEPADDVPERADVVVQPRDFV